MDKHAIKGLLRKENPVVLEIGAHYGSDTEEFLEEFKNIRIFCFEPDPRCIEKFKQRIRDPRCSLLEAAVSDADGRALLHQSSGWPEEHWWNSPRLLGLLGLTVPWLPAGGRLGERNKIWDDSSSLKPAVSRCGRYPWLLFEKDVEVRVLRLDTWTREQGIRAVDFIWADVQGAERELIHGAGETLRTCKYLYMEYGETSPYPGAMTRAETIELLGAHGFEAIPAYSSRGAVGNLLFNNRKGRLRGA
ncbi:MAG: FkbM family methyltransferase [Elusimicrobia bacterium]|nr:FkbM family methyltransferase [Elusimicrobiota bacterium]